MFYFFFCKQKTAYEMRISDWSSDVCSSDLLSAAHRIAASLVAIVDLQPSAEMRHDGIIIEPRPRHIVGADGDIRDCHRSLPLDRPRRFRRLVVADAGAVLNPVYEPGRATRPEARVEGHNVGGNGVGRG